MPKFTLQKEGPSKIQGFDRTVPEGARDEQTLELIIKVNESNYVPDGVTLRARIDDYVFTAEAPADELDRLEADPLVVSISVAKPLRIIE